MKCQNEQEAKCDEIEKREAEKRQMEEKKYSAEIEHLKGVNQQLKVMSYSYTTGKKIIVIVDLVSTVAKLSISI